jgi:putative drug exporter of the RND superfamily
MGSLHADRSRSQHEFGHERSLASGHPDHDIRGVPVHADRTAGHRRVCGSLRAKVSQAMFERLGRFVFRFRFLIVALWALLAGGALLFAPSLSRVGSADQASFLPADSEAMAARAQLAAAFPDQASAGVASVVFSRPSGLTGADETYITSTADWLTAAAPEPLRSAVTRVLGVAARPELAATLRSQDGRVELLQVQLDAAAFQPVANEATALIREHLATTAPAGLQANVTGSVGIGADYLSSIFAATDRTTLVTVVLVILVLLLIYRAPLAALVPLLTIGAAYLVASGILGYLAEAGWRISSLIQTFVIVLVFGVGTDYTIFLISRFREEVAGTPWGEAIRATERRIGAVITASAATVIVGLGSMVVGRFGMFQTTGPALAIAIAVTLLAGLTLAPALLGLFGHYLFWPRHERTAGASERRGFFARLADLIARRPGLVTAVVLVALIVPALAVGGIRQNFDVLADLPADADAKVGFDVVATHFDKGQLLPASIVLTAPAGTDLTRPAALAQLRTLTDQLLATGGVRRVESLVTPGQDGQTPDAFRPSLQLAALADRFVPSGSTSAEQALRDPATLTGLRSAATYLAAVGDAFPDLAAAGAYQGASADLARLPVAIEALLAAPTDPAALALKLEIGGRMARLPGELRSLSTTLAARPDDYLIPQGQTGSSADAIEQALASYVADDRAVSRVSVVLADDPYSTAAFDTIERLRAVAAGSSRSGPATQALVGGSTAEEFDLRDAIDEDFLRVAVLTVIGVLLVLMLLLRSLVAPLYLVGTVLLSYLCTMGLSSWWFQTVLGQPGLNYFLPLMVFVLLVALGSDYNIFLMSRVREESARRGTRDGIRAASARTGAVITSAGVILAGTFLALIVSPLTILAQVGATVAVGVLIDTFVVRSLLVPALTTLLGDAAWWPMGRAGRGPTGRPARPADHAEVAARGAGG